MRLARFRQESVFYVFALPFMALTVVFGLWPIALSLQTSFTASASALQPHPVYVGLANYASILTDPDFLESLWRTMRYTAVAVIANIGFALLYALLLDSAALRRTRVLHTLAVFLPIVTPEVAGYVVWRWLYDRSFGAVNAALHLVGLPAFGGVASAGTVLPAVVIAELWAHAGFYVVIFLANLAITDRSLSEAAAIDGATPLQRLVHVVLPQLRPAITVNLVYALIQFLKTFTVVVVMTKGGPNRATNFVSYDAYRMFDLGDYGVATAMATVLFAMVILIGLGAYRLTARAA
jgi:ABC-type sugar transport system permease subunit